MKFCQKCGNELSDDAVFCPKCGDAVESTKIVNNDTQQQIYDVKTSGVVIFILNAILLPVVGLVFGIIILCKRNKTKKAKTVAIWTIVLSCISWVIWFVIFMSLMG